MVRTTRRAAQTVDEDDARAPTHAGQDAVVTDKDQEDLLQTMWDEFRNEQCEGTIVPAEYPSTHGCSS